MGTIHLPSPFQVLIRVRLHTSRSKGKSAFLVLRQQTATIQAILFVDDNTVSKGMVKYAAGIPRESILDVEARVVCPDMLVEGCTQNEVEQIRVCVMPSRAGSVGSMHTPHMHARSPVSSIHVCSPRNRWSWQ